MKEAKLQRLYTIWQSGKDSTVKTVKRAVWAVGGKGWTGKQEFWIIETIVYGIMFFKLQNLFFFFKFTFIYLNDGEKERQVSKHAERDLPTTGWLPKCLQQLGLGQLGVWSLELEPWVFYLCIKDRRTWATTSCFPGCDLGSWTRRGARVWSWVLGYGIQILQAVS